VSRREFNTKTRKAALLRSGMVCEAVGVWYGLPSGQRCATSLSLGVEYDHIVLDANSKDNSLENCAAVCIKCHRFKTAKHDTPTAAKTVAQSFMGMKTKVKAKIPVPRKPERTSKPSLPRRYLYAPIDPEVMDTLVEQEAKQQRDWRNRAKGFGKYKDDWS
jgi:hypothetical protein